MRGGKPVSITPKAFQLLLELVKNHGHLMAKDELMKTVWANSFVEEGNLAFTIRMLRKALGDTPQNPRFIETVTKRGYRFIGDVRCIETEEKPAPENFHEPNFTPNKHQFNVSAVENGFAAVRRKIPAITNELAENGSETFIHFVSPVPRSLFGRDDEIAAVENLLKHEDFRLITLTGIGGSGKTSLARVIAANRLTDFPRRRFFLSNLRRYLIPNSSFHQLPKRSI